MQSPGTAYIQSIKSFFASSDKGELGHYLLATLVGVAAGLAAIAFRELITLFDQLFYGRIGETLGEPGTWPYIFIPALGGLIVGPLIYFLAREAKGAGIPEVMLAVEQEGGRIRHRVAVVKAFASAITIGSGGSVGREGPIVQISSGIASSIGQFFRLPDDSVRLLVAAGAAAGVSATFNAPIAGVFFALEIILRHFNVRNFAMVVISSVVAAAIGHAYFGQDPAFFVPEYELESVGEFPLYLLLGCLAAITAIAFVRTLNWTEDRFDAIPIPGWSKAAVGGLLVGIMGLQYMELLGTGYGSGPGAFAIPSALVGEFAFETLAVLVVMKIIATSLTVGSGGSGGVFAPSLFIGAMLGGAFGEAVNYLFPGSVAPSGAYATVGMAAVFAGGARTPMTAVLILFELTRDYSIILPLMVSVVTATALSRALMRDSVYSIKLRRRGVLLAETRLGPLLTTVPVGVAMHTGTVTVPASAPASALIQAFTGNRSAIVVVGESNEMKGIVTTTDLQQAMADDRLERSVAIDIATQNPITVFPDESLDEAVRRMSENSLRQLPVVSRANSAHLLGMLDRTDIFSAYARQSHGNGNNGSGEEGLSSIAGIEAYGTHVLGITVSANSELEGKRLEEIKIPEDILIASIIRRGEALIPRGRTTLQANDWLVVIASPGRHQEVHDTLRRAAAALPPPE